MMNDAEKTANMTRNEVAARSFTILAKQYQHDVKAKFQVIIKQLEEKPVCSPGLL